MTEIRREEVKYRATARCPLSQEGGCQWSETSYEVDTEERAREWATNAIMWHLKKSPQSAQDREDDRIHEVAVGDFFIEAVKVSRTIFDVEEAL